MILAGNVWFWRVPFITLRYVYFAIMELDIDPGTWMHLFFAKYIEMISISQDESGIPAYNCVEVEILITYDFGL